MTKRIQVPSDVTNNASEPGWKQPDGAENLLNNQRGLTLRCLFDSKIAKILTFCLISLALVVFALALVLVYLLSLEIITASIASYPETNAGPLTTDPVRQKLVT